MAFIKGFNILWYCGEVWTQVNRGQSRWCLLDLHNLSLTHTHTHTSDIIAACQVCSWWPAVWHWPSCECVLVCIPCSLCVKWGPLFTSRCCQLGTKSQDKMLHAQKHTHTHTYAHTHAHHLVLPFCPAHGVNEKRSNKKTEEQGKDDDSLFELLEKERQQKDI